MKIKITKYNKDQYIESLINNLQRLINYCKYYPGNFQYDYILPVAEKLLIDYNSICLHILNFCFGEENIEKDVYPKTMKKVVYDFLSFCYNKNFNLLSLQEQNELTKKYVHYDFSVNKIKTLNDL